MYAEGQRLLFESAYYAIMFSGSATIILFLIRESLPITESQLYTFITQHFVVILSFFSFFLAHIATFLLNLRRDRTETLKAIVEKHGNELDQVLAHSMHTQSIIAICLKNNKYYVGWARKMPSSDDFHNKYIRILPALSGYRDKDTLVPKFTAQYLEIYISMENNTGSIPKNVQYQDFEIIIPTDEIFAIYPYVLDLDDEIFAIPYEEKG